LLGATPVVLVGPELNRREVYLQAVRGREIQYFAAVDRRLVTESLAGYLRIEVKQAKATRTASVSTEARATRSWVELTDGQRLAGQLIGGSQDGKRLLWRHSLLGEVELTLEQVRLIDLGAHQIERALGVEAAGDVVVLRNGDVLQGFLDALTGERLVLQLEDGPKEPVVLTLDRVAAIRLANPRTAWGGAGHRIRLTDGTRMLARGFVTAGDELVFEPVLAGSTRTVELPLARVASVDLKYGPMRLVPLSELKMVVDRVPVVFTLKMPPYVEGERIHLHAPGTVHFELPDGARRWAGRVALDRQATLGDAAGWSDCEVIVRGDGRVLAQQHLSAEHPAASINVPVDGINLEVELQAGANGPVLDRVVIEQGVVLVEHAASNP